MAKQQRRSLWDDFKTWKKTPKTTEELLKVDSIEKILEMDKDFKCASESSGEAASKILNHLGIIAEKEGFIDYNFMEPPSVWDLSYEQRRFLTLCGQCFFCCSAEWRRKLFPAFLSSVQGVLLINSSQLHIIANENLLKTTVGFRYIIFSEEYSKYTEKDYADLITIVEDLKAVVVGCSGEKKASEFLKKHEFRPVDEFFLKKEQRTYLYFSRINLHLPTEMIKEVIVAPESTATKNRKRNGVESSEQENTTGLRLTKNSDSNSYSNHCLSMVWDIDAYYVDRSVLEILPDALSLVTAPREIGVEGKYADACDAKLTKNLVKNIKFTNRLKKLILSDINLTANEAAFIAESLYKVPNLSLLDLSYNPLLGEGVSFITENLSSVPDLETLRLEDVKMTRKQVDDLTTAVQHSKIYHLSSSYHDNKGNMKPEDKWPSEYYWKRYYRSIFPDSSSELEDEQQQERWEERVLQDDLIPAHVQARGKKALAAYHRALKTGGSTYDKRVKVLVVGQDRVGKTSLCKSLRGEEFNENEPSTDGVHMISPIKNAGTEAWRNPPSLEHTTVFDHKIAVEVTRELLSTSAEQPAREESSESPTEDVIGDIQEPTMTRKNEHPMPSTAGETKDLGRQHAQRQDAQQTTMAGNQQNRENQKKPPYAAQEKVDSLPEECVFLVEEQLKRKEVDQGEKIWPVIWDFAGQDIYRAIHPIFMSSEDIYLLVSDLTIELSALAVCRVNLGHKEYTVRACDSEDTNFDHILRWLDLIHSLKKGDHNEMSASGYLLPPVILVGTHADRVDDPNKEIDELAKRCSGDHKVLAQHIKKCSAIDNKHAGKSEDQEKIIALRKEILELADEMPHTKQEIPLQWHRVEKEISKPEWQRKKFLRKKTFQEDIVSLYCTFDNEDDLDELIYFLHGRGTIVYHKDASDKDGLVILDAQWLINVLCEIIKVKSHDDEPVSLKQDRKELQEKGILSRQLIDHACRNQKIDVIKESLISLMEKFNLICKWPAKESEDSLILVPCMLTLESKGEIAMDDICPAPVYLTFKGTNYVPGGLFCRLVVLFGKWLSDPQYTNEYDLHANEALFALEEDHSLHLVCYKTVIKLHISTNVDEHYKNVLSHLKEFLVTLKKECHWLRSMSEELCARCTMCLGTNAEPCALHGERPCRHHDCGHYISLKARVLCCKPGCPLPREPLQPWIRAFKEMNLFTSRDTAKSHPGQSGIEKPTKRKSPSEDAATAQTTCDVQLTHSVLEPPSKKSKVSESHLVITKQETKSTETASDPPEVTVTLLRNENLPGKVLPFDNDQLPIDILLLAVKNCEFLACLSYLNEGFRKMYHKDLGFVYLGDMGEDEPKLRIVVMKSQEGGGVPGGSAVVVMNAVNALMPKAVFCVGCCGGLNFNKVNLGDVVILTKLITYAPSKVTVNGIEEQGVKVPLKPLLSKLMLNADDGWKAPLKDPKGLNVQVHRGAFLSGPEVIDNDERRSALITRFPEAVAVEMEGEGLYAAAHDLDIEWIVIKGVSDYADGRNSETNSWRQFASLMAASLTAHILSNPIVFQYWHHHRSTK